MWVQEPRPARFRPLLSGPLHQYGHVMRTHEATLLESVDLVDFTCTLMQIVGAICLWRGIWVSAVGHLDSYCGQKATESAESCRSAGCGLPAAC